MEFKLRTQMKLGLLGASTLVLAACSTIVASDEPVEATEAAVSDVVEEVAEVVEAPKVAVAKVEADLIPREMIFGNRRGQGDDVSH